MDRESPLVKDGKYRAIIWAVDNDGNVCFYSREELVLAEPLSNVCACVQVRLQRQGLEPW